MKVCFEIQDVEISLAVDAYPEGAAREAFLNHCLKIGFLALQAAQGSIDSEAIKSAGDHLIEQMSERMNNYRAGIEKDVASTLARYFDPTTGAFNTRVDNLVKGNGDLERLMQQQIDQANRGMAETFERFLGENSKFLSMLEPSESNRLLSTMREGLLEMLRTEREVILGQFSLDNPASAINRLLAETTAAHGELTQALANQVKSVVNEFSLDRSDSALSRLVGRVEAAQRAITNEFSLDNSSSALVRLRNELGDMIQRMASDQSVFQREVGEAIAALSARRAAEAKSTTHGAVFEEAVGAQLRQLGCPGGDIVEDTGMTTGVVRNSKVGDFVVVLPPESAAAGARIVVEAKESASYTMLSTLNEADEARRNRSAGVCIFVHSHKTAPEGMEVLSKYGNDIVCVWNPEDASSHVVFKAAYLMAKALSIRSAALAGKAGVSLQAIEKSIEVIRKTVTGFDEMKTSSETIQNGALKMLDRIRIMRTEMDRQLAILTEQLDALKTN